MTADRAAPFVTQRRASAAAPWRARLIYAFLAVLPVAAVFSHRAFAPALAALLAACALQAPPRGLRLLSFSGASRAYAGFALLFFAWAGLSAIWSPTPNDAHWAWRLGSFFLLANLAAHAALEDRDYRPALIASVAAMLALLCFEAVTGGLLRRLTPPSEDPARDAVSLGRGALLLVLLVWPAREALAAMTNRTLSAWALVAAAAIPALSFGITTNAVMLASGLAAYSLGRFARWGARLPAQLCAFAAALVWVSPVVAASAPYELIRSAAANAPASWLQRMHIYARAGEAIAAAPLGGGAGYARALHAMGETVEIGGQALNTMPLHPHNLFLHVWLELGAVGAVALSGLLLATAGRLSRAFDRRGAAMVSATIAALIVTASTEWSLWQVWRLAAVFIAVFACRIALSQR